MPAHRSRYAGISRTQASDDLHTSLACSSYPKCQSLVIMWSFVSPHALASCVGCDLVAVPRQLHAAPPARPFLARVMKVQNTMSTLADAVAIHISEQCRSAVCQWGKQVFGLARFEPRLRHGCPSRCL